MKRPPMVATLKFRPHLENENGSRGFSLWIPLFIIVPVVLLLLLVLALLVLPLLFLYVLITCDIRWWRYLSYGVPAFFETTHELLGLKVDVEDRKQKIYIDFN